MWVWPPPQPSALALEQFRWSTRQTMRQLELEAVERTRGAKFKAMAPKDKR